MKLPSRDRADILVVQRRDKGEGGKKLLKKMPY